MFGIKLDEEVTLSIADQYETILEKLGVFCSKNPQYWVDQELTGENEDEIKITMCNKGLNVPEVQLTLCTTDDILTYIDIFGSDLFNKLIINNQELDIDECMKLYGDKVVSLGYCKELEKTINRKEAHTFCHRAKTKLCNSNCVNGGRRDDYIDFEDDNIRLVLCDESGFEKSDIQIRYGFMYVKYD